MLSKGMIFLERKIISSREKEDKYYRFWIMGTNQVSLSFAHILYFTLIMPTVAAASGIIPREVRIGLLTKPNSTITSATVNFSLTEIQKSRLLPNTTLIIKWASSTKSAYQIVDEYTREDVVGLIETENSPLKSELIADVLNATTFKIGSLDCDRYYQMDDYSMCDHALPLHQSLKTLNKAVFELLKQVKITHLIILYDVLYAKQVSNFVEQSQGVLTKYVLLYINFDNVGKINPHSLSDLKKLHLHGIWNLVAFCSPSQLEVVIDIVNLYCPCSEKGITWILPVMPGEVSLSAGPMDKVVAFRISTVHTPGTSLLKHLRQSTEYCKDVLPDSAALVHDSLMMLTTAIHQVILSGKWKDSTMNMSKNSTLRKSGNAQHVRDAIQNTRVQGITGPIDVQSNGERNNTLLELLLLQRNKFTVIGSYSTQNGLQVQSPLTKNRELPSFKAAERTIRVVAMEQHPFVLAQKVSNTTYTFSGYSYDVLKRLSEDLNLKFKITRVEESNIDSLIHYLTNGAADIILNPVIVSAKRQRSVVFTKPLMHFPVALMVREKQQGELDLTQFMLPFTVPAWCLLLSSWFVVTVIVHILDRYSPYGWRQKQKRLGEKGDEFSLFNSLWFCLACMLTQGADQTPRNLSGRVLACCFWFCILIWNATYTANLASFLTLKDTSLPVTSLSDAKSKGYDMTVIKDSSIAHVLNISSVSIHQDIWNDIKSKNLFVKTHLEGAEKCRNGKTGFIAEKPFLEYIAGRKPCELVLISNVLQPMSFAFALPLNSKFVDSLSLGILRLQEKGITESFERKWWEYRNQCPKTQQEVSQSRLDVKEMLGVYLVLAVGIVLSLAAVVGEIWWKKGLGEKVRSVFQSFHPRIRPAHTSNDLQPKEEK